MRRAAILMSLFVWACEAPPPEGAAEVEAIMQLNRAFGDALSEGDVDALMSMLTGGVMMMAPESPTLEGAAAVRARFETTFSQVSLVERWESFETFVEGELAYDLSFYTVTITPLDGGETVEQSGRNLNILRRQRDGSWKFSRLLWNRIPAP